MTNRRWLLTAAVQDQQPADGPLIYNFKVLIARVYIQAALAVPVTSVEDTFAHICGCHAVIPEHACGTVYKDLARSSQAI